MWSLRSARRPLLAGLTALFALVAAMLGSVANAMPAIPQPARPGAPALSPHAVTDPPYDKANAPWGPDVSGFQHPGGAAINWATVRAAGASFAFVKASEGTWFTGPYYRSDAAAARAQGLYVGAYHFGRPSLPLTSAVAQANYFANIIGVQGRGWLPPVLDLEVDGGLSAANLTAWTHTFLQTLQARTGRVPIIYTGSWFYRGYMFNPSGFGQYPLWDALYNNNVSSPGTLFGDWTRTTFWQYTWLRTVPGITGVTDASYFHGSRTQLAALANDAVVPAVRPYGAIGAKWAGLGGATGFLGKPLNNEYAVPGVAGARMEDFAGGTVYWSAATGAHEVHGAILAKYRAAGNAAKYGLPVTDESKTPDGIGRYNHFTGARSIYWTLATNAHLVYGAIRLKWASLGWERGRLGYPTTDEYAVAGGRRNDFQHGSISWASLHGMLTVLYR